MARAMFSVVLAGILATATAAERPNVVFIAIDDLNDWVGCLGGHPQVKTPNIDALAKRGTVFLNAHVQSPLCNPSRSSLLTGLRPSTTGIYGLAPGIRDVESLKKHVTLPQYFTENGYETFTCGKVYHDGSIKKPDQAREFKTWGERGPMPFPPKKLVNTPSQMKAVDWGVFPEDDRIQADWKIASAAIEQLRATPKGQPFFIAAGFRLPHVPCFASQKWFDLYPENSLLLSPVLPHDRADTPLFSWFLHWTLPEPRLSWLVANNQWKPLVRAYLASTSFMDSQVGRLLDALRESGAEKNTIVVLWSDNGWHLGEKAITGKNSLWDRSTHVPLIFAGPGIAANGRCKQPAELLDIYPTLVELSGLPARQGLEGHSLVPQLKNADAPRPWPAITTHNHDNHGVRTDRWRFIHYADGSQELYDMKADPNEWKNLASDPKYAATIAELKQWLPKINQKPVPGSAQRILTYDPATKEAVWEGKRINPAERPDLELEPAAEEPVPAGQGSLRVVNGNFSDLAGLTRGDNGWFGGVPAGWRGSENRYAVHAEKGPAPPTCNPSTLGFLRQNVGTLGKLSDVALRFDVSEPWKPDVVLNASILDGNLVPLAAADFTPGARRELVAKNVAAGTAVIIAFHAAKGTPGLDNVSVSAKESTGPIAAPPKAANDRITVASYYFGNYHTGDPRNEKNKGKGWSEWDLVKAAKPRFPGHHQPSVPLWGYTDESDPKAMEQKIDAAADHGIDAFIFDWYYYNDGPFLDRPIDLGFLKARNNARIKFAFMWANHDWIEIHPYKRGTERKVLYPGTVTPENFDKICDHVIANYFRHPSYWRIDGRPYFSFYELTKLLDGFGSVKATRAALDRFRAKAVAAGLPGLHLNAVVWGRPILPGEKKPADPAQLVKDLGFDSVTSYVWIHHAMLPKLQTDYNEVRDAYFRYWNEAEQKFSVPYYPNVTMGWDSSPRAHQDDPFGNFGYPFTNTIAGNTPERFKEALAMTKRRLLAKPDGPRILNINCWNEWTEGSYLEPDTVHGLKYLEAVRDVFGK